MSFDLMVFDPGVAPRERANFMQWYEQQTEWAEDHDYDDPAVASPALQRWFADMVQYFPPMNGPLADPDVDGPEVTDHCIGRHVIYSAFAWPVAKQAHARMRELAILHGVGFFHASDLQGELLFPDLPPPPPRKRPWWRFW